MTEEELKAIKFIDKNLDNMKKELKEIEKENETNCIIAIEHLRYQIYHLEIIKHLIENSISKDKIRELRDIDNIDLIQYKLKKLLEE